MASRRSLASVLPDLTRSPIRNCHFQTPGVSDLVSVYSTPLWFMGDLPHAACINAGGTEKFHLFNGARCRSGVPGAGKRRALTARCRLLHDIVGRLLRNRREGDPWMRCRIGGERAAPRKRSMVAWRRRLIPRVMQCPRQEYVWVALKRFNAFQANTDAETKHVPPPYLFDGGVVLQIIPRRRRPRPHGPMRRGRLRGTALVEPDADPFFLAPGYVARPFQLL